MLAFGKEDLAGAADEWQKVVELAPGLAGRPGGPARARRAWPPPHASAGRRRPASDRCSRSSSSWCSLSSRARSGASSTASSRRRRPTPERERAPRADEARARPGLRHLRRAGAALSLTTAARRIYFCSEECREAFRARPDMSTRHRGADSRRHRRSRPPACTRAATSPRTTATSARASTTSG